VKATKRILSAVLCLLLLAAGCGQPDGPPEPDSREITDMAGRTLAVPAGIKSVFPTDPTAAIYLYTVAPDRLLGWNYALNDVEKRVIPEKYHSLPNLGMGDAVNYEAVIAAGPDMALQVSGGGAEDAEQADRLAERLGIPVVVVSDQLADTPAAYRLLGELLGAEEQAEALAAYAADTLQEAAEMQLPEEKRVRVYYGNKEDSLETVPAGSLHGQVLDLAGAVNVADVELSSARVRISLEQLLAWDPDVIVVNGEPKASLSGSAAAAGILNDPDFAALTAVRNGAVYGAPSAPFSWIERPPGPNRIIGVRWLAGLLYPDAAAYDVDDEVREFFRLFYHVELSEEQLDWLF